MALFVAYIKELQIEVFENLTITQQISKVLDMLSAKRNPLLGLNSPFIYLSLMS